MPPSPIRKVLFIFRKHRVKALLMGGQACIVYGAAEFSRDIDFAVLCDTGNLQRLTAALKELKTEQVYVPALQAKYLLKGHACHFRCHVPGADELRIDIMSVMRGCDNFNALWKRRRTLNLPRLGAVQLLSVADLVQAKKTQRDKDWPMVKHLVGGDYLRCQAAAEPSQVKFWLQELRTPEYLIALVRRYPAQARKMMKNRPLLRYAIKADVIRLEPLLKKEEERERTTDQAYWKPLRKELEELRRIK